MQWKTIAIGLLLLIFFIVLYVAHLHDEEEHNTRKIPNDMQDMVSNIVEQSKEKRVKKIINSAKDQIMRGMILGITEGSIIGMLQTGALMSLANGIVSGMSSIGYEKFIPL